MTRLPHHAYVAHLRHESRRFRDVFSSIDLEIRVPSCPDWSAADLLWHLGAEVQLFWATMAEGRPDIGPDAWSEPARPDSAAGLFDTFDEATSRLTDALAGADPTEPAWTWSTDRTMGFIGRRQAHEALIHRLDAELAAGTVTALDPALAADGVDEVLAVMYGGSPDWGAFTPGEGLVRFDLSDAGVSRWVRLGTFDGTDPDEGRTYTAEPDLDVVPDPGTVPDAVVSGPAGPMDAWLWHRGDDAEITVTGDQTVRDRLAAIVGGAID